MDQKWGERRRAIQIKLRKITQKLAFHMQKKSIYYCGQKRVGFSWLGWNQICEGQLV